MIFSNTATILIAEDWEGFYFNNKLVLEGHKISDNLKKPVQDYMVSIYIMQHYKVEMKNFHVYYVDPDYDNDILQKIGHFPKKLQDVKLIEED